MEEKVNDSVFEVFSTIERDQRKRKDIYRTYIYNITRKYVIVLEPQFRSGQACYLLSAYYLNESYGEKTDKTKIKEQIRYSILKTQGSDLYRDKPNLEIPSIYR